MLHRKDRIGLIERRIGTLSERATDLLRSELAAVAKLEALQEKASRPMGRLAAARSARALGRTERLIAQLRAKRAALVDTELRSIMVALERQSRRTRDRLDRELERLEPVEAEWERLRCAFGSVGGIVATPAIEDLAGQWRGGLEIPEFPVREGEGYPRPFPQGALLF